MSEPKEFLKPSWTNRRRIVYGSLVFCAVITIYLTIWGKDDELRRTIAAGVLLLAGTVICSYVFGAVIDDKHWMSVLARGVGRRPPVPVILKGEDEHVDHDYESVRRTSEHVRTLER